jgi:hypothetical protein
MHALQKIEPTRSIGERRRRESDSAMKEETRRKVLMPNETMRQREE